MSSLLLSLPPFLKRGWYAASNLDILQHSRLNRNWKVESRPKPETVSIRFSYVNVSQFLHVQPKFITGVPAAARLRRNSRAAFVEGLSSTKYMAWTKA